MRNRKLYKAHLVECFISLTVCAASAVLIKAYPALAEALGSLITLFAISLAVCVSFLLATAFEDKTGVALSEYLRRLYCGRGNERKEGV